MPAGRPTVYTDDIFQELIERISEGESVRSICKDEHMPSRASISNWLLKDKKLLGQYIRAKTLCADRWFDEILEYADEALEDSPAKTQAYRLKVDTYKWVLARMEPSKYGDRVENIHKTIDDEGKETGFKFVAPPNADTRET